VTRDSVRHREEEGVILRLPAAEGIAAAVAGVKSHLAPRRPTAPKEIPSFATS
jgi:hypothetical protein